MKKIGIVSAFDPHSDRKAHSGILYKINEAIEKAGFETVWVKNPVPQSYRLLCKFQTLINLLGIKKHIYLNYTKFGAKLLASTIDRTEAEKCDYLMVLHHFQVPAYFKTRIPIIYHSDATFELANNYYIHNLPQWNIKHGNEIEQLALNNSAFHLSSSVWRQKSLVETYHQSKDKCFVLEYGPCVEVPEASPKGTASNPLRLFFSGVVWERKGGDIAVEAVNLLNQRGINAQLTIVGIKEKPQSCIDNPYIDFRGFLNKNDPKQYEELKSIYKSSDIFLLPTKAECSGIVFCESSVYGLPVVTYDTGGVGSYVVNGVNGYRLPEGSPAEAFSAKIEEIVRNGEIPSLSAGALKYGHETLTWANWTKWFKKHIQ